MCVCVYIYKETEIEKKRGVGTQPRPEAELVRKVEAMRFPKDPRSEWREKEVR